MVFNGVVYENNSEIYITNVGEGSFALSCRTSLTGCCKSPPVGEWYYPDGQIVNVRRFEEDYYRNRDEEGNVYLNRRNSPQLPRGIYRCTLPDQNGLMVTLHVGLYIQEGIQSLCNSAWCSCKVFMKFFIVLRVGIAPHCRCEKPYLHSQRKLI